MDNTYCVYRHTGQNGKSYVGMTKHGNKPNKRWQNGKKYEECTAFQAAIDEFGWESFSHEILASGLSKEEALECESYWIMKLRSNDPDYGYNLDSGGGFGKVRSEETKSKISLSHYGIHPSEETKEKLRKIAKSRPPMSQETKDKISKANKGFKHSKEECEARRIRALGRVASEETRKKISQSQIGNKKRAKPILCVETGEVFGSAHEASLSLGFTKHAIASSLYQGCRCGGYHWRYVK